MPVRLVVFSLALFLAGLSSCKRRLDGESNTKTVDLKTAAGTLVYLIDDNMVLRFNCVNGREAAATIAAVKSTCNLIEPRLYPGEKGITLSAFDKALTTLYLKKSGAGAGGELNAFETKLKRQLLECLKKDASCDPLANIPAQNQVVAGRFQASLMGDMADIFDGKDVQLASAQEANAKAVLPPKSLGLSGETVFQISEQNFSMPAGVRGGTLEVLVHRDAPPVNHIQVLVSQGCAVTMSGIAKIYFSNGGKMDSLSGDNAVQPASRSSFFLAADRARTPLELRQVNVVLESSDLRGSNCTMKLWGRTLLTGGERSPKNPAPGETNDQRCTIQKRNQVMAAFTSTPAMRQWHYLWHGIRNGWDQMSSNEQSWVIKSLGERWRRTARDEDIGEEFLHMHHVMTKMVKDELRRYGCDMFPAWVQPPEDNDGQQVVTYDTNNPRSGIDQMRRWHETAMDIPLIKSSRISLGAFGSWLEDNLHNSLHSRHADPNGGIRFDFSQISLSQLPNLTDPINAPANNWLAHPYSAHVNPYFWSLHGYIDEKIFNWLEANGYDGLKNDAMVHDRTRLCDPKRDRCYQWRRTWDGLEAQNHRVSDASAHMSHGLSASEVAAFKKIPESIQRLIHMNSHMIPFESDVEFSH